MDYLKPEMTAAEANAMSMLALAHVGDGVYELLTRTMLARKGHTGVSDLHHRTVEIVNAPAQAKASARILPVLTEEELAVFKRGRNAKVMSVPQNAEIGEYHAATGLEALFGWLYLRGKTERVNELYALCAKEK